MKKINKNKEEKANILIKLEISQFTEDYNFCSFMYQ